MEEGEARSDAPTTFCERALQQAQQMHFFIGCIEGFSRSMHNCSQYQNAATARSENRSICPMRHRFSRLSLLSLISAHLSQVYQLFPPLNLGLWFAFFTFLFCVMCRVFVCVSWSDVSRTQPTQHLYLPRWGDRIFCPFGLDAFRRTKQLSTNDNKKKPCTIMTSWPDSMPVMT